MSKTRQADQQLQPVVNGTDISTYACHRGNATLYRWGGGALGPVQYLQFDTLNAIWLCHKNLIVFCSYVSTST